MKGVGKMGANIEWYERVVEELMDLLIDKCEEYADILEDSFYVHINKAKKHPSLSLRTYDEDELEEVLFDPYNQYFYVESPNIMEEQAELIWIFREIDDLVEHLHMLIHEFVELDADLYEGNPLHSLINHLMEDIKQDSKEEESPFLKSLTTENVEWITEPFVTEEFRRDSNSDDEPQIIGSNTHFRIGERNGNVVILKGNTQYFNTGDDISSMQAPVLEIEPNEVSILLNALQHYNEIKKQEE